MPHCFGGAECAVVSRIRPWGRKPAVRLPVFGPSTECPNANASEDYQ